MHGHPNNMIGPVGWHVTHHSQSQPFSGIASWVFVLLQLQSWGCQGPCSLPAGADLSVLGKKEANLRERVTEEIGLFFSVPGFRS